MHEGLGCGHRKSHRIARKATQLLQKHQRAIKAQAKAQRKSTKPNNPDSGPTPLLTVPGSR